MKKSITVFLLAGMLTGCAKKIPPPVAPAPEYTNTIAGELEAQKLIADWAYAYGKAEVVIAAQREKLGSNFPQGVNFPEHSQEDMERQAAQIFWDNRTAAAVRARAK